MWRRVAGGWATATDGSSSLAALLEQAPTLIEANGAAAMGCRLHVSVARSTDVEMHTGAEAAAQLDSGTA